MTPTPEIIPQTIDAPTPQERPAEEPSLLLIDVRESGEYASAHIPGAISHPLSQFDPGQIHWHPGQRLVVYCQSGKRSAQATEHLKKAGLTDVTQLQQGLTAWQAATYPVTTRQGAPISLFRQVQIVAGSLVVVGTLLGATVSPWALLLSGFVGMGLVFAGVTNTCAMGMLLARLPYNQRVG
jgi:rhodanese-related sulfurtransferase